MIYKAIGLISSSSLYGLNIIYTHIQETGGKWSFEIMNTDSYPYTPEWRDQLRNATSINALEYLLLHSAYGHYIGGQVNHFIDTHNLQHKVDLVASHGHTTFDIPANKMNVQLGDGASIAAETGLPVISDLIGIDLALGGEGGPIESLGEKLLLGDVLKELTDYKAAFLIALMGVRRWREEYNILSSVTGASRDSIGGALWLGVEA